MTRALLLALALASTAVLAGCVSVGGDVEPNQNVDTKPPGEATFGKDLPDVITSLVPVAASDVPTGSGIWVHGDYAYVAGLGTGFHVVDVANPEEPKVVGALTDDFFGRDVDFLTYDDGRLVAVVASQGQGMNFVNVTDPTNPTLIATINTAEIDSATHNVAVLPGTHLVFNSASNGEGGDIDVIDAANPYEPAIVASWGTHGCHDVTFFLEEGKHRAYCPGIEETQIWDITDPLNGKLVSRITNFFVSPGGAATGQDSLADPGLHHLAIVNEDASLLIVGDEFTGGLGPGCGVNNPVGPDTPIGSIYFYDITDETTPALVGWFTPNVPLAEYVAQAPGQGLGAPFGLSCTSHFGSLIPGKDVIAMSWYRAGVLLIDFSDPAEPMLIDQWNPNTNTWDVKYANGYLFTGDMHRGLDVLTLA